MTAPATVVVIGAGLIGTSVALALRERGTAVWLADADPAAVRLATDLGAGQPLPAGGIPGRADVAVLAVPPQAVAPALLDAQRAGLGQYYTDVASVKELPLRNARALGCDLASFVPGHPLAGRERSGPAAARADLFAGRPWALCPAPETTEAAVLAATDLAAACGAQPIRVGPSEHDQWVALVSHAPHLVAAAMAAQCADAPAGAMALAGPGLTDVTRIAAGDPSLWTQILAANAGPIQDVLTEVAAMLYRAAEALAGVAKEDADSAARLTELLEAGTAGVARIPGKHGGPVRDYALLQVVIGDQPGELARLFAAVGEAGINIEDVRIEHSPGLPVGVAELSVRPESAVRLDRALTAAGWPVASPP